MKLVQIVPRSWSAKSFLPLDLQGKLPVGYWPLPPSAVTNLPDYMLPPAEQFYTVTFGRVSGAFAADRRCSICGIRTPRSDGRGVGKGFTLGDELDTDEYAARFAKNYFYNNAIPAASDRDRGRRRAATIRPRSVQRVLKREYGGRQRGKVMVTGGKVSVARLDTDFQKMDLGALRKGCATSFA
jgi:hypothetical protein